MELDWQISEKNVELRRKQQEVEQLDQAIQGIGSRSSTSSKSPSNVKDGTIYSLLSAQREMFQELPQSSPKVHDDSSKFESPVISQDIRHYSPKSRAYQPDISDSSSPYSGSFKSGAKQLSPVRKQAYFGNISPISKESPTVSSFSDTSSSPFKQSSPLMQSYSEKEAMVNSPRRAFSSPSHRLTRDIATVDPTTQNINQVRNRIDIGKSFNMRTVCQTSSPYHQNTRVESILPESGGSDRMINNPLNIKHTAELSPTQYVTPFISKTRFGYTDPTARVFNIPPGDDINIPTELRTSSPSTSPKYFGPSAKQQIEDVSTVITHDSPPAVTPTTTRRHGLFTPKGIFRKRHFNVRKLYRPGEYQSPELPWSPQYLPRDYRSPIRSIPSTPTPVYADQSLPWEKSPDYSYSKNRMNQTYKASPILSETYRGDTSYATSRIPTNASNRNFNASTLHSRNRTFATAPPYIGNRDSIFSVSPTDRNFARSTSYSGDRTFAVPHQDLGDRDRTFSGSPTDRNFARSTSYSGDRTFAVPPQDLGDRDRTFSRSPTDRNFARSTSYSGDRSFAVSPQDLGDRDRTFSGSPTDRNLARSTSY